MRHTLCWSVVFATQLDIGGAPSVCFISHNGCHSSLCRHVGLFFNHDQDYKDF